MLFRKKEKSDRDLEVNPFYKDKNALIVYIKCDKCGEVFRSHLKIGRAHV